MLSPLGGKFTSYRIGIELSNCRSGRTGTLPCQHLLLSRRDTHKGRSSSASLLPHFSGIAIKKGAWKVFLYHTCEEGERLIVQQYAHSVGSFWLLWPAKGNAGRSQPPPAHEAFGSSTDTATQNLASCAHKVRASVRILPTCPQKQGCEFKHSIIKALWKQNLRQIYWEAWRSTNAANVFLKRSPCNTVHSLAQQQQINTKRTQRNPFAHTKLYQCICMR